MTLATSEQKFATNVAFHDQWVNGAAYADVQTPNGPIPTMSKIAARGTAYVAFSPTQLPIGTGERVFTIDSRKSFLIGQSVMAVAGNNWLQGDITAYVGNSLTVNVTSSFGADAEAADWLIGLTGATGPTGATGATGPTGARGPIWIVLARDPNALDGSLGDYYINSLTLEFFQKVSQTTWGSLGHIGGGNVFDAPADNGSYLRKNQAWVALALDRLDYKTGVATAVLDLSVQQNFNVDATTAKTLSFANAPVGRAMPVVVKITGSAGGIVWPAGISWSAGIAPVLGASFTIVVLYWDGAAWVGSTGPSA